jgi:hypothetical protein
MRKADGKTFSEIGIPLEYQHQQLLETLVK